MSNNPFLGLGFNSWAQKFSRVAQIAQQIVPFLQYLTTPNISSFTLRSTGTVNYRVDWGDGNVETLTTTSRTHTYSSPGQYTIKINPEEGSTYRPYFNNAVSDTSIAEVSFPGGSGTLGSDLTSSWYGASNMTSFSEVDTSSVTNFTRAWSNCSNLTSFPLIDTSSGTNFSYTWFSCSGLTSFPLIDTSSGTDFTRAWSNCSNLTSFPLIDTSSGTNFSYTWYSCSNLTSFPLIDTSSGTDFIRAWSNCSNLTSFPLIDTSSGTNFQGAWNNCNKLTSFPLIDTSNGTNFSYTWNYCYDLTSFPPIDVSKASDFSSTWYYCSSLVDFPPNMFDNNISLGSVNFQNCKLSAQSIENIIVSIDTNGAVNRTLNLHNNSGGPNAGYSTWTATAQTALANLQAKGWSVTYNP